MNDEELIFNPAPGWPKPPAGWRPPKGWAPDPAWPEPPPGWQLWLPRTTAGQGGGGSSSAEVAGSLPAARGDGSVEEGADGFDGPDQRIADLEAEVARLRAQQGATTFAEGPVVLDDQQVLQEVGIYRYHHPLENAVEFKERLGELSVQIADFVRSDRAIERSTLFTFDNSLAKGRRMTSNLGKLMLRAYNAEVDNCLRSLRVGNVVTAKSRVESSKAAIARLGQMMEMRISETFHDLRIEEIELTADYLMKKQEEKEAAREERARLREERKVEAELAAERDRLDKERRHLLNALEVLRRNGESDADLEQKLSTLDVAIERNDYRAANIRAGYVYVISNRGAFGENVVKIGLTRRLEPMDRVNELGDASVPFRFDVHSLFFSEDAVTLESELHRHFESRRVNQINTRKEFFFATPAEVRDVLASKVGSLLEFTEDAQATEYFQSRGYWSDEFKVMP